MCLSHSINNTDCIDIHTHILPEKMPDWSKKFGYGGFVSLEHHKVGCARMMIDDIFFREIMSNCWNPEDRMKEMIGFKSNVQVLSTIPVMFNYHIQATDSLMINQFLNDHISEICQRYPDNFVGLGSLPMQDTDMAIKELERCIKVLGLKGIEIGTNINDLNLSEPQFNAFWEAAQELNACIFVHPWNMMGQKNMNKYWLPWLVGMPAESSRAICSLIFGGVFEKFPKLRFAFAHGGGSFPFTLGRVDHGFEMRPDLCAIDNNIKPSDYCGHFWVDSLVHSPLAMDYNIQLFGEDKIVVGSDYPFPLGELSPGELVRSMKFNKEKEQKILVNNAIEWLVGNK
jgi:aminocarboxymuconate-semialdehyde decarboxylase